MKIVTFSILQLCTYSVVGVLRTKGWGWVGVNRTELKACLPFLSFRGELKLKFDLSSTQV